jgi:asparagine synthase (glutamine-hydrolysing)
MCGINGFNWKDRALIGRMNDVTHHRGPDDSGVYEGAGVTVGNNRLAIIDLSPSGHQPMESEDGRYVIVFNGEIYNFRELRNELSDYRFKGTSDTEVILAGYARWGRGVFARLNGVFALALWDIKDGELLLARDRYGVKPLYYAGDASRLIFSSEVKAICMDPDIIRQLDRDALAFYLRLGYVPAPRTLFKGIKKLLPGHLLSIKHGVVTEEAYVSEHSADGTLKGAEAEGLIRDTLDAAVKRQLVSERPVGLYLSGGFDSTILLDSMTRAQQSVDSYSVGFEVADSTESEKFNADFLLARKTAAHYGTRHHELMLGTTGLAELFEDVIYHLDEPIGNGTALAQLALSRFAKDSVTVALTGDGGDELFGGYPRYLMSRRMDAYQALVPPGVRALLSRSEKFAKLNIPAGAERYDLFHFVKDDILSEIAPQFVSGVPREAAAAALRKFDGLAWGEQFMHLDREWWLVDEALVRTDKMTMAAGIEARVPFLDNEMVALSLRIALSEKVDMQDTKKILKRAFRERLPAHIYNQPKRGWFSPSAKWLREPVFERFVREALTRDYANATRDLFDWEAVGNVLSQHVAGRRYNLPVIWRILSLQVWARRFDISA